MVVEVLAERLGRPPLRAGFNRLRELNLIRPRHLMHGASLLGRILRLSLGVRICSKVNDRLAASGQPDGADHRRNGMRFILLLLTAALQPNAGAGIQICSTSSASR